MMNGKSVSRTRGRVAWLAVVALAAALGCTASASATVSVKTGFFFGHDLRQAQSVVYVLDLSGSMSEASGSVVEQAGTTVAAKAVGGLIGGSVGRAAESRIEKMKKKIEKVKLHLIASLQGLPPGSTFNIIMFSDGVQKLAPGMIQANAATKTLVSAFVDRLEEGGSTNMYKALEAAVYMPTKEIILLTDGEPTSSTPEEILDLLRRKNQGRFIVSTVGVGNDHAREFLEQIAAENGGTYTAYD
ncbi:MAG: VWA domain-containing protein [Deltaproteobacteria bacterium]|nr:MAG: VWA domain-containing protein [Deltaproteobacteria bacterium]